MVEAMPRIRKLGHVGAMPMLPYSAMASQGSVWTAYGLLLDNPAVWTPTLSPPSRMLLDISWVLFKFQPLPSLPRHERLVVERISVVRNLCASMLGLYYMFVYGSHSSDVAYLLKTHVLKKLSTVVFSIAAYVFFPHDLALNVLGVTGNVMTVFMFGGPLTAIQSVVREKNTRALNLGFTCIVNLNCAVVSRSRLIVRRLESYALHARISLKCPFQGTLWFFYAYFMLDDPYIYLQDGLGIVLATAQLGLFARYGVQRH